MRQLDDREGLKNREKIIMRIKVEECTNQYECTNQINLEEKKIEVKAQISDYNMLKKYWKRKKRSYAECERYYLEYKTKH